MGVSVAISVWLYPVVPLLLLGLFVHPAFGIAGYAWFILGGLLLR